VQSSVRTLCSFNFLTRLTSSGGKDLPAIFNKNY
jgi:hypothetical protein